MLASLVAGIQTNLMVPEANRAESGTAKMRLLIHPEKCTGCRACELACSYHHKRLFSREFSSLIVSRNEKDGFSTPSLRTLTDGGYMECDLCHKEKAPLCLRYCVTGALEVVQQV